MLVITTPDRNVDFPGKQVQIALDNPQRKTSSRTDAYAHAEQRLRAAAKVGGVNVVIGKHGCRGDCSCVEKYQAYESKYFDSRFS